LTQLGNSWPLLLRGTALHRDMLSLFDILTAQTVGYGRRY